MKRSDFLRHNKYTNFQNNKDSDYYYTNIMCLVNIFTQKSVAYSDHTQKTMK